MKHVIAVVVFRSFFIAVFLAGCVTQPKATPVQLRSATAQATVTELPTDANTPLPTPDPISCADLDSAWSVADWATALQVLDRLEAVSLTCGEASLDGKRYAVHINYAVSLENAGDAQGAVAQYQAALAVNGRGSEALDALIRLNSLPTPTAPPCSPGELAPYSPSAQSFATVNQNQIVVGGSPFYVRGINYYPRNAPWDRFLTDGDSSEIAQEFDLIASAGFNTLRIFLWYDPLFTCVPETATPNPTTFHKLDAIIGLAAQRNLRLIVTLNDLPDLLFRPLYSDYARYDAQTTFIVNRYRDEPAIVVWDLRNEGDIDYGAHPSFPKRFERNVVFAWVAHVAEIVRANDSRHLVTVGWWGDASDVADVVDILSFHHWSSAAELSGRLTYLQAKSDKPILLEEIGYPSTVDHDETSQAQKLKEAIEVTEQSNIAGWLVWTAFDFTPPGGQPPNIEHSFGLWHTDLAPKPVLEVLPVTPSP